MDTDDRCAHCNIADDLPAVDWMGKDVLCTECRKKYNKLLAKHEKEKGDFFARGERFSSAHGGGRIRS